MSSELGGVLANSEKVRDESESGHGPAKCAMVVSYNGERKSVHVELTHSGREFLQEAIKAFSVQQNPHLLSLYADGTGREVVEGESLQSQQLHCGEKFLLRPNAVKAGKRG